MKTYVVTFVADDWQTHYVKKPVPDLRHSRNKHDAKPLTEKEAKDSAKILSEVFTRVDIMSYDELIIG